ncbi:malto-oligosyltrehalose synthase [Fundidesulfovibrio soli]|uniref:malto-oligosyltrehalose synthase n=1 Tax=Fundidesulfovibrio soli TaxID=2922716 RepID=UPI001FB03570|nr:malto-oligosyltrehalose synthase [Fundidesulfovibrio soli]
MSAENSSAQSMAAQIPGGLASAMVAPLSTYRLQLHPGFGFAQCRETLPYLAALGISHVYASPIFKARAGSTHGYDVCDHQTLNPELGTTEEFDALMAECKRLGMGWIQDIVPNHMAVSGDNGMLVDVLENGESSRYFNYFDIEWNHPYKSMAGRMLAPFLGVYYSQALDNGEIQIRFGEDGFSVHYYGIRLPLRIDSYGKILTHNLGEFRDKAGRDHPDYVKLLGILYNIENVSGEKREPEHYTQIFFIKRLLNEMYQTSPSIRGFIDANIRAFNGQETYEGDRYALLDDLLSEQFFRLSFWKVAGEEINYRRFFSINDLISLRSEDEAVFYHTHKLILERIRDQSFSGVRVDHIDGLFDPSSYLQRLRGQIPGAYVAVEKILTKEETLPTFWPIHGTTGYDFMSWACNLFVHSGNEGAFQKLYAGFAGMKESLADILTLQKREIIRRHMAGDVDNLARLFKTVSVMDRRGIDITMVALKQAITELLVQFPVYRTYISHESFRPADLTYVRDAIRATRRSNPDLSFELDFLQDFLLLEFGEAVRATGRREWVHFVMRFQQVTGPLMAKAMEDSTFYVFNRLLCLNEVGSDPGRFGMQPADWHASVRTRMEHWPAAMNATGTHDCKRGEDARMRLAALSELPEQWGETLKSLRRQTGGGPRRKGRQPSRNELYFLYQTLLAHMPFGEDELEGFKERLRLYLVKAMREAKVRSNWLNPNDEAEKAFCDAAESLLGPKGQSHFMGEFQPLLRRVARVGMVNSLSQALLKIAAPGIPDFYQGSELWDFSMVDPDNRRPVDFGTRRKALQEMDAAFGAAPLKLVRQLLERPEDGRIKLFLIWRGLHIRKEFPGLFTRGEYLPLAFTGARKDMAFGFARSLNGGTALAVVPRLFAKAAGPDGDFPLGAFWEDTALVPPRPKNFIDAFTGREFPAEDAIYLSDLFRELPLALLTPANGRPALPGGEPGQS